MAATRTPTIIEAPALTIVACDVGSAEPNRDDVEPDGSAARRYPRPVEPILHLSLPVTDLDEARHFYVERLGCEAGRVGDGWADVWFYGLQLTLQDDPAHVLDEQGERHFGVTLDAPTLAALVARLEGAGDVRWLDHVTTDFAGTARQQTKAKVIDPSGNVIELKSYADPAAALTATTSR
jgi:extradiol dioxygenase family protein